MKAINPLKVTGLFVLIGLCTAAVMAACTADDKIASAAPHQPLMMRVGDGS